MGARRSGAIKQMTEALSALDACSIRLYVGKHCGDMVAAHEDHHYASNAEETPRRESPC